MTHEFGADRSTGSGDEDSAISDEGSDCGRVDLDDAAVQDVFVGVARNFAWAAVADELLHRGHHECVETGRLDTLIEVLEFAACCGGQCQQDGLGSVAQRHSFKVVASADDSDSVDPVMSLRQVVIDQSDWPVGAVTDRLHCTDRTFATFAGAVHDDCDAMLRGLRGNSTGPHAAGIAMPEHEAHRERCCNDNELAAIDRIVQLGFEHDQPDADTAGRDSNCPRLVEAELTQATAVEAGCKANTKLQGDGEGCDNQRLVAGVVDFVERMRNDQADDPREEIEQHNCVETPAGISRLTLPLFRLHAQHSAHLFLYHTGWLRPWITIAASCDERKGVVGFLPMPRQKHEHWQGCCCRVAVVDTVWWCRSFVPPSC